MSDAPKPEKPTSTKPRQTWLEMVIALALLSSVLGVIAALWFSNLNYAIAPMSLTALLNLGNRKEEQASTLDDAVDQTIRPNPDLAIDPSIGAGRSTDSRLDVSGSVPGNALDNVPGEPTWDEAIAVGDQSFDRLDQDPDPLFDHPSDLELDPLAQATIEVDQPIVPPLPVRPPLPTTPPPTAPAPSDEILQQLVEKIRTLEERVDAVSTVSTVSTVSDVDAPTVNTPALVPLPALSDRALDETNSAEIAAFEPASDQAPDPVLTLPIDLVQPNPLTPVRNSSDPLEAIAARYAAGERAFVNANLARSNLNYRSLRLVGIDLRDLNAERAQLAQIDLAQANLSRSNFQYAQLKQANLSHANLTTANLCGASLQGANLRDAQLLDADLSGADLSYADLSGADLSGATLENTTLYRARLEGTKMPDGVITG